jgi:hypothetical protein
MLAPGNPRHERIWTRLDAFLSHSDEKSVEARISPPLPSPIACGTWR